MFGQPPEVDAIKAEFRQETCDLPYAEVFDYIDRALVDPVIHERYASSQIGTGLQLIYTPGCSDWGLCYTKESDEQRRIVGIRNLRNLYSNYFQRHCVAPVQRVGYDLSDGTISYVCYMFWDDFLLYPGAGTPAMIDAAVTVMEGALQSRNEQCLVSAIHGLGHWRPDVSRAGQILMQWLRTPTTTNKNILDYAEQAASSWVL